MFVLLRFSSAILVLEMLFVFQNTNAAARAGVAPISVEERFTVLENQSKALKKDYFTLCSLYTDMAKRLNDVSASVNDLRDLSETVSGLGDRLDELEGQGLYGLGYRVNNLEATVASHTQSIGRISARLDNCEVSVFRLEARLKGAQDRAASQMSYKNHFNRGHVVSAIAGAAAFGATTYMSVRLPSLSLGGIRDWVTTRFK